MNTRFDALRGMDRLADELLSSQRAARIVPLDAYKAGDHVVMHLDLPGVDPGSVDVTLDRGVLTVRAQRSDTTGADSAVEWLARERFGGSFTRQIALGDGLDADALAATYDAGVLTITVPVAEKAKPRKIQVEAAASSGTRVLQHQG